MHHRHQPIDGHAHVSIKSRISYRGIFSVRLFTVHQSLPVRESVETGQPATSASLAVPIKFVQSAIGASIEAGRVLGQRRRRFLAGLVAIEHGIAAVQEGRIVRNGAGPQVLRRDLQERRRALGAVTLGH